MNKRLEIIKSLHESIRAGEVVLFCGAGISKNSGLPLANELKEYILGKLPIGETGKNEIMDSNLPFETFIETLSENTDISSLLDLFKDGEPNATHILIARLAKQGCLKTIFTTNFDLLIERALENEGLKRDKDFKVYYNKKKFCGIDLGNLIDDVIRRYWKIKGIEFPIWIVRIIRPLFYNFDESIDDGIIRVLKIHGSVEDKASIKITLKGVTNIFIVALSSLFTRYIFSAGNHQKVLVIGYSCSDEFDIIPQIQRIDKNHKKVIFIDHFYNSDSLTLTLSHKGRGDFVEAGIEDIAEKAEKNPFKNFPGKRIKHDTDKFIESLWESLKEIVGIYNPYEFKTEWKKYVDEWSKGLEENKGFLKYFVVGSIFYKISSFKRVLEYYEKSFEIAKSIGDKANEQACYGNLGIAYHCLGDLKKAIEYQERSLLIAKNIGYTAGESVCYTNLGIVYGSLRDSKKELEYFKKSLETAKKIGDLDGLLTSYTNLGEAYYSLGDFKRALRYYGNSAIINVLIERDVNRESMCLVGLGSVFCQLGDFEMAIKCYETALIIIKAVGDKARETRCYKGLDNAYRGVKDLQKKNKYFLFIRKSFKRKFLKFRIVNNFFFFVYDLFCMRKNMSGN